MSNYNKVLSKILNNNKSIEIMEAELLRIKGLNGRDIETEVDLECNISRLRYDNKILEQKRQDSIPPLKRNALIIKQSTNVNVEPIGGFNTNSLKDAEKEIIRQVLIQVGGQKTKAAKVLGISVRKIFNIVEANK